MTQHPPSDAEIEDINWFGSPAPQIEVRFKGIPEPWQPNNIWELLRYLTNVEGTTRVVGQKLSDILMDFPAARDYAQNRGWDLARGKLGRPRGKRELLGERFLVMFYELKEANPGKLDAWLWEKVTEGLNAPIREEIERIDKFNERQRRKYIERGRADMPLPKERKGPDLYDSVNVRKAGEYARDNPRTRE
jgi:hypothetical protein